MALLNGALLVCDVPAPSVQAADGAGDYERMFSTLLNTAASTYSSALNLEVSVTLTAFNAMEMVLPKNPAAFDFIMITGSS
jgi:hypothetical protein